MKKTTWKLTAYLLAVIMAFTVFYMPAYAADSDTEEDGAAAVEQIEDIAGNDFSVMAIGDTISGSFDAVANKDVATIRYYTNAEKTAFSFAEFSYNSSAKKYEYSFKAPYDGFNAVQGTSADDAEATVIAEYYATDKWDGAVDVSWYDSSKSNFNLGTGAELAGVAAIVNGSINTSTPIWAVKGERADYTQEYTSDMTETADKQGLPSCIENEFCEDISLIGPVSGDAHKGLAKNDFANKTINLTADIDLGGADASEIDHTKNFNYSTEKAKNSYDYPNWTPIGGEYLMDVEDASTMIIGMFNGSINGCGHAVTNIYCYRHADCPGTAWGYCQGTGLIGMIGSLYDGEENPEIMPSVKNLSLTGYVFGRRMVGGIVGCMGGGSNAANGSSVPGGVTLENLANYADIFGTDSKGIAGIVACSMVVGSVVNCYNRGNLDTVYGYPTGGIIGSNEGMDVYCCYNTGTIASYSSKAGRGIGSDNAGSNYSVGDCYYLNGCGDDPDYPGYYTKNMAASISVTTEAMSADEMRDGTLLEKLNVNGTAYVAGDDGLPVLYWEKQSGQGTLTVSQPANGTVTASKTGSVANGTVVYLQNTAKTGYKFRYYTLNGERLSGKYATVNGSCTVSAMIEEAVPGTLKIAENDLCDISVVKNGTVYEGKTPKTVEDYPVKSGDPLYVDDVLIVTATLKPGAVPEDPSLQYTATTDINNPFTYSYTYTGKTAHETDRIDYTVTTAIEEDDTVLTLDVIPKTTKKLWRYTADTSWYDDGESDFTLENAAQLAGLAVLVDGGTNFAGKTVRLANDISMTNTDGTEGLRYWDGIGTNESLAFAGTFDGQGHSITEYHGSLRGLFGFCTGSKNAHAVVKNVTLKGEASGANACGIAANAKYTDISGCSVFCRIRGTSTASAGILGKDSAGCSISNCFNYGCIDGKTLLGGIAGYISTTGKMSECVNYGNITCDVIANNQIGGIVGSNYGAVSKCANYGNVTGAGRNIGGVAGQVVASGSAIGSLTDCYNAGTVMYADGTTEIDSYGGIIGFGSVYKATRCFNYGSVIKKSGASKYTGGAIGKEGKNSKSATDTVYYLNTSSKYAEDSTAYKDLGDYSYTAGIISATAADFANKKAVLTKINTDGCFVLKNGKYPELDIVSGSHIHTGGSATCAELAVCSSCGLEYGSYDNSKHGTTSIQNAKDPVWAYDGYTGDKCCNDCGAVITKGKTIKADTAKTAVTVRIVQENKADIVTNYSVAEFDSLKTTSPLIQYQYGGKSKEIMVAVEYVTISDLMSDLGIKLSKLQKFDVLCTGTESTISKEVFTECNKYFIDGTAYDAPAAIAMTYDSGSATMEEVADGAKPTDNLRFGYGISQKQHDENTSLGGMRLISPVKELVFHLDGSDYTLPKKSVSKAKVTGIKNATYTGKAKKPVPTVKLGSLVLKAGTDYTVRYKNNTNAGKASVIITGKGKYKDSVTVKFTIAKAANTLTVKAKTASVSKTKVKKKAQILAVKRVLTVKKNQGKVTYAKVSGSKQLSISKTGKVTVKKKTGKGTYKMKVKAKAAGNANYKAGSKTVTVTVKVK